MAAAAPGGLPAARARGRGIGVSMTPRGTSVPATTDLDGLGLDAGGHLLVGRALADVPPGDQLTVTGRHPALGIHLAVWCTQRGHRFDGGDPPVITKGPAKEERWPGALRAGI